MEKWIFWNWIFVCVVGISAIQAHCLLYI